MAVTTEDILNDSPSLQPGHSENNSAGGADGPTQTLPKGEGVASASAATTRQGPTTALPEANSAGGADTARQTDGTTSDEVQATGESPSLQSGHDIEVPSAAQVLDENVKKAAQVEAPRLSYVELYKQMSPHKPLSSADEERERKKRKREAIFSAIGDGISALSNLYFTTQYAPNAYDASKGLSARSKERWDKLMKEREANQREYMSGLMRAMEMDAARARDDRNFKYTVERDKVADHYRESADLRAEAKAERDAKKSELQALLLQEKITWQQYANDIKDIENKYADDIQQSRINKNNKTGSGGGRGSGGGGRPAEYPWYDSDGTKHFAYTYEAMRQNAIDNGTWNEQTQESTTERTTTDRRGKTNGTTSSKTTKPAKGHSSAPQGKRPNPMS